MEGLFVAFDFGGDYFVFGESHNPDEVGGFGY
jgi:hypothetical protein